MKTPAAGGQEPANRKEAITDTRASAARELLTEWERMTQPGKYAKPEPMISGELSLRVIRSTPSVGETPSVEVEFSVDSKRFKESMPTETLLSFEAFQLRIIRTLGHVIVRHSAEDQSPLVKGREMWISEVDCAIQEGAKASK